jgi:23S rRNA pseudouridine1911/1915/1917 synthase
MKFDVIYEDEHTLVIDKPINIMVHPDGRSQEKTIADYFLAQYPKVIAVGDEGRHGIVHRLDRNTSGVLLLAKDNTAYRSFKSQFKEHTTRKVYRAIVEGHIRNDTGMISLPLARAKSDFRKKTVVDLFSDDFRGEEKEAITRYKVLERIKNEEGKTFTYVEVYPLTGRTHQIRAHFRGIRHPIVGDDLYGSKQALSYASRSMLHALSLTVKIPGRGEQTFVSEVPKDMQNTLAELGFSC